MNFSLKSLVILAISGALSGEAKAIDSGFYNGSHVCNGALTLDDWEFRQEESSFDVFFRKTTASSFQKLELVVQDTDGGLLLVDRRGRPWIAVRFGQNGDSLQGRWLTGQGKPQSDCEPFTLSRSESAKARMDRLFGLLGEAHPTVETARTVAEEQQKLPPIDLLPDLDQQAYRQRYAEAAPSFWRRFHDAERKRLAELPVAPPDARDRAVGEMRAVTSLTLAPEGSLDRNGAARQAALDFLRIVADRLAASGRPLEALPGDTLCERMATFGSIDVERLELAVGLPVEYWDRTFTEDLLQKAQSCKDGRTIGRLLSQSYPDIEKRRKAALWLREEQERLLALPLTLTSFRDTNGLQLSRDELRRNDVSRMAHDRFLGAPLETRRTEMEQAAARELQEVFGGESVKSLPLNEARSQCDRLVGTQWGNEALSRLHKTCTGMAEDYVARSVRQVFQEQVGRIEAAPRTFAGLEANNWFLMGTGDVRGIYPPTALVTEFNGKVADARAEAVRIATGEVDKAFASADPYRTPRRRPSCNAGAARFRRMRVSGPSSRPARKEAAPWPPGATSSGARKPSRHPAAAPACWTPRSGRRPQRATASGSVSSSARRPGKGSRSPSPPPACCGGPSNMSRRGSRPREDATRSAPCAGSSSRSPMRRANGRSPGSNPRRGRWCCLSTKTACCPASRGKASAADVETAVRGSRTARGRDGC